LACALLLIPGAGLASGQPAERPSARALSTNLKPWRGDLDGMIQRRMIRVLVPHSRTLYFNDKGRERGFSADLVRDFERYINKKYAARIGKRPITVVITPTARDQLLTGVAEGAGDIAAGALTVTDERLKIVDFVVATGQRDVSEIVLTGPRSPVIHSADDLAGQAVHVRKSSSYHESLLALNRRLEQAGRPAIQIILVPEALEDEDMMEMLNAGILTAIVVDDWKAAMWSQVLPGMKVNGTAVVRVAGKAGWAIRKDSPELRALLNEFYVGFIEKQNLVAARLAEYHRRTKRIADPTEAAERARFQATIHLFERYAGQYGFDPLLLAAQGYQESRLDQEAKSGVGAIGIMQIMPATGKSLGVGDIRGAEQNVHAGAKYMDMLMSKYFRDAKLTDTDRSLFAFASYNVGSGNIAKMRREAARRGLDPDRWFDNVEVVTAEKLGAETTTYVRNIYKYYVSYRLMRDIETEQAKARESLAPPR
jgi:membrane-bound lytic murein transglycosylase MltF